MYAIYYRHSLWLLTFLDVSQSCFPLSFRVVRTHGYELHGPMRVGWTMGGFDEHRRILMIGIAVKLTNQARHMHPPWLIDHWNRWIAPRSNIALARFLCLINNMSIHIHIQKAKLLTNDHAVVVAKRFIQLWNLWPSIKDLILSHLLSRSLPLVRSFLK